MSTTNKYPWSSDRPLDLDLATRLIAKVAPELAGSVVEQVGEGWDNEVYAADGEWFFRFPKRREVVATQELERLTSPLLAAELEVAIPCFQWFGEPTDDFPYPYLGYRRVPGVPLEVTDTAVADRDVLVPSFARVLDGFATLDSHPVSKRLPVDVVDPGRLAEDALRKLDEFGDRIDAEIEGWRRFCEGDHRPARWEDQPVYVHNDLFEDHLMVDPETGELSGIIDFADQAMGDPVLDLLGLASAFDLSFAHAVARKVSSRRFSAADLDRLHFFAAVFPMRWACHAARRGEEDGIRRNVRLVERVI